MLKIGVTGGIGSGKSIACSLFQKLGASIYDSDRRAKELTNSNLKVVEGVKELFGDEAYLNGTLQTKYLASKVFSDHTLLDALNKLIHPIVTEDFKVWCIEREQDGTKYILLECAILIESGFISLVDIVVCVTAPRELRISRVLNRGASNKEEIEKRMNNQLSDKERLDHSQYNIINDDKHLIMPQILKLNSIFANGDK